MSRYPIDFPIADADNHLYETEEAFTRYLPERYAGAIRYVQVGGRTKIAINGLISEYIPNPTFEVVAPPGAQEEYFRVGNPDGRSLREIFGKPIRCAFCVCVQHHLAPALVVPRSKQGGSRAVGWSSTKGPQVHVRSIPSTWPRNLCALPLPSFTKIHTSQRS